MTTPAGLHPYQPVLHPAVSGCVAWPAAHHTEQRMVRNEQKCCKLMQESLGKTKDRQRINDCVPGQTYRTHPYHLDVHTRKGVNHGLDQ